MVVIYDCTVTYCDQMLYAVDWSAMSSLWKWQNGLHNVADKVCRWRANCVLPLSKVQVILLSFFLLTGAI